MGTLGTNETIMAANTSGSWMNPSSAMVGAMHTYSRLPDAVVEERLRQRVTLAELVERTGLPLMTVRRYCQDQHYAGGRYEIYEQLAQALGLDEAVTKSQQHQATEAAA